MSQANSNPLFRFVRRLWDAVNFFRRLVLNALFLFIVAFVLLAMFMGGGGGGKLEKRSALVLAPQGALVEQFSADPMERAMSKALGQASPETQLRDVLRAIDAAATDARIERLVIRPDKMTGAGYAALREIAAALARFRKSGKQVVAYGQFLSQKQYFLAAQADEVYLHPEGAVLLEGLARYRAYYREALADKLGVDVHLLRVGEYKSAGEPYILDAASDAAKQADLFWMNDVWGRFLADIGMLRGIDPASLQADLDAFDERLIAADGDMAGLALKQKLVDGLMTPDEWRVLMIDRGVEDTNEHTFRHVALDEYLGVIDREKNPFDMRPKVAVVVAQGEIMDGDLPPGQVGGDSTSKLLRQAREDDSVKAVVLRVDSPGGGVFASELIRREVELVRNAGKPVVVSMANVAASGGYWISMNADRIYADPSTITGSIGIYGLFMTIPRTLEKIGVHVDGVATTKLAGAFDPTRPLQPIVERAVQANIDRGYRQFVGNVAAARGATPEAIDKVARGRVWSGAQAKEHGLVDELGGLTEAIADAARRANLGDDEFALSYVEKELSPFEKAIVDATKNSSLRTVMAGLGLPSPLLQSQALEEARGNLRLLEAAAKSGAPYVLAAHCFCEL